LGGEKLERGKGPHRNNGKRKGPRGKRETKEETRRAEAERRSGKGGRSGGGGTGAVRAKASTLPQKIRTTKPEGVCQAAAP